METCTCGSEGGCRNPTVIGIGAFALPYEASRVINILTKYGIEDNAALENSALADYAKRGALSENLNSLNTKIEDLSVKLKTAKKYKNLSLSSTNQKSLQDVKRKSLKMSIRQNLRRIVRRLSN